MKEGAEIMDGQGTDAARAARYGQALLALESASKSAVRENGNPNRVVFQDGFVIEGRLADEWLRFMRLIQRACRAALDGEEPVHLAARVDMDEVGARWKEAYAAFAGAFDTPLARRRQDDEFASDARRRMKSFDAFVEAGMSAPAGQCPAGWQPMDTAPRNGRKVDLWVVPHDAFANVNAGRIADASFVGGEWRRSVGGGQAPVDDCGTPVAWMAVPDGPATDGNWEKENGQ